MLIKSKLPRLVYLDNGSISNVVTVLGILSPRLRITAVQESQECYVIFESGKRPSKKKIQELLSE